MFRSGLFAKREALKLRGAIEELRLISDIGIDPGGGDEQDWLLEGPLRASLDASYQCPQISAFNPLLAFGAVTLAPPVANLPEDTSRPTAYDSTSRDCLTWRHNSARQDLTAFLDNTKR